MPDGLKRYYGRGHLHSVTFSCYRQRALLNTMRARSVFVEELGRVREEMNFRLIGYLVMPERVHLLMMGIRRIGRGAVGRITGEEKLGWFESMRNREERSQPQRPTLPNREWARSVKFKSLPEEQSLSFHRLRFSTGNSEASFGQGHPPVSGFCDGQLRKACYSNCLRKAANWDCRSAICARSSATSFVSVSIRSISGRAVEAGTCECAEDSAAIASAAAISTGEDSPRRCA